MEFYHTKKRLILAASSKVSTDWNNHILFSKAELLWKTDREAVKKAAYVRVKTKCVPRFSAWVEVLDPCHTSLWRAMDFDTNVNYFVIMTCTTSHPALTKALIDQAYAIIRNSPKDQGTDLRLTVRTPSTRKPPPTTGGATAALRAVFEQGRDGSSDRRNLYSNHNLSPGQSSLNL